MLILICNENSAFACFRLLAPPSPPVPLKHVPCVSNDACCVGFDGGLFCRLLSLSSFCSRTQPRLENATLDTDGRANADHIKLDRETLVAPIAKETPVDASHAVEYDSANPAAKPNEVQS